MNDDFKEQPCIECGKPVGDGPYDGSSMTPRHWECRSDDVRAFSNYPGNIDELNKMSTSMSSQLSEIKRRLKRLSR